MKSKWVLYNSSQLLLCLGFHCLCPAFAKDAAMPPRIAAYDGKTFTGFQDPEYFPMIRLCENILSNVLINDLGLFLIPKSILGLISLRSKHSLNVKNQTNLSICF